ncbi:DNA-deoxyinosine glycosylase [Flavobacterium paronense]|uniref:DNA-deoxyinosine glycosylase n=1 Tax=Flavobacterium paronense TaxID=1392775 RepID=A0ABV5GCG6_9FLAO|nr:DNA-deoxyinosine glycosylase [Flavobacterium paronense]MDN3676865.1 DNA-deoxyinosine glycosylase [Flavobacterium paronense]
MTIQSFPSIADTTAKILILGTMPGAQSLALNEYYGNRRNHFWQLLFTLCNESYSTDYQTKKNLILTNRIALWDVLQACERQGSLDSAILKEVPNDFDDFLKTHPYITHIFFNGQQAAKFFKKYVTVDNSYTLVTLPSTSPANAGFSFQRKLEAWKQIVEN